jgi:hypothetical protein
LYLRCASIGHLKHTVPYKLLEALSRYCTTVGARNRTSRIAKRHSAVDRHGSLSPGNRNVYERGGSSRGIVQASSAKHNDNLDEDTTRGYISSARAVPEENRSGLCRPSSRLVTKLAVSVLLASASS